MFRKIGILFSVLLWATPLMAQLQIVPVSPRAVSKQSPLLKNTSGVADTVLVDFPFFDDFSQGESSPAKSRWTGADGVYVNNHMVIDPPSIGVATLDGVDSVGVPYDFPNPFNVDIADKLTSHAFDLSGFTPADSFYIGFYWQAQGLGERPDPTDSLLLQVIDTAGNWQTVWGVGGDSTKAFQQEIIPLENATFFHSFSRFRFVNFARLSGPYDTWHLDYIHFYRAEEDDPKSRLDVTITEQPSPVFEPYTAMPLAQFLATANPAADTIHLGIRHLSDTFNVISHGVRLRDAYSGQDLGTLTTGSRGIQTSFTGTSLIFEFEKLAFQALNDLSFVDDSFDSLALEYTYFLSSNETNALIPTTRNDTLQSVAFLHDYFAYDDGSAEFGIGVFQRFGQIVYEYTLSAPAQITAIDVYLTQIGDDLRGQTFNILLFESIDTADQANSVRLLRQNLPVLYSDAINQFRRFQLVQPFLLQPGTFYIGVEQLSAEPLTIGYDVNTESGSKIFFNTGARWQPNRTLPGSMMLRPVFGRSEPVALPGGLNNRVKIRLYPNPASQSFRIGGSLLEARLLDLAGKMVKELKINPLAKEHQFSLDAIPAGLYFVKGMTAEGAFVEKLLVE